MLTAHWLNWGIIHCFKIVLTLKGRRLFRHSSILTLWFNLWHRQSELDHAARVSRKPALARVSGVVTKPKRAWGGMKHRAEMDLRAVQRNHRGKQQIKHTLMQGKRCNFIIWDLLVFYPRLNLLFQASVSCLTSRSRVNKGWMARWGSRVVIQSHWIRAF